MMLKVSVILASLDVDVAQGISFTTFGGELKEYYRPEECPHIVCRGKHTNLGCSLCSTLPCCHEYQAYMHMISI